MKITHFLSSLLVVLVAGAVVAEETISLEKLRAMRREAANRQRRVIFNNDGTAFLDSRQFRR